MEAHHARAQAVPPPGGTRRKAAAATREWLVVSPSGGACLEEVGKHQVMARTGLPARDLRVLDPHLSYPSSILGRERAIVVNLERFRAVITAHEVLIPNSKDPVVAPFVRELQARVSDSSGANQTCDIDGEGLMKETSAWPGIAVPGAGQRDALGASKQNNSIPTGENSSLPVPPPLALCKDQSMKKVLPFEFRALEACLESTCRCLEAETLTLEQEAYPALDELTSKISTLNLERVRQIKSRLVAISGRVQKVRDELEQLLDDDMDMAEMYLTEKLMNQRLFESSLPRIYENGRNDDGHDDDDVTEENRGEDIQSDAGSSNGSLTAIKPNIEELEMLLEAYFVQIDGTLNKLSHLREYVDDTEDYINIMLDDKQNQLLQMGVMLSTATVVITAGVVVVGLFGMNIGISLFNDPNTPEEAQKSDMKFWGTTFGTIGGCVILYIMAIGWGKKSGLLQ
ncbi:magnesium transporter MRS2-F-like protein [Carex littledalei]|uniref:Magnesium transporter n=1 Tax=Carex littledalei TaxID=544730 RepID=A0A833R2W8_9POAL|nr:magnesium transporter MRS2-F-like protein [Carex littledalei]